MAMQSNFPGQWDWEVRAVFGTSVDTENVWYISWHSLVPGGTEPFLGGTDTSVSCWNHIPTRETKVSCMCSSKVPYMCSVANFILPLRWQGLYWEVGHLHFNYYWFTPHPSLLFFSITSVTWINTCLQAEIYVIQIVQGGKRGINSLKHEWWFLIISHLRKGAKIFPKAILSSDSSDL